MRRALKRLLARLGHHHSSGDAAKVLAQLPPDLVRQLRDQRHAKRHTHVSRTRPRPLRSL
jgi:hypothetical protein